jgi:NAD(P)H-dependent FMN reductase
MHIAILSTSLRQARKSHRVVRYFKSRIEEDASRRVDVLDLQEYNFPLFDERIRFMENPPANVLDFADRIRKADGVIIVTPEYNGGYPASLKNVIDLLKDEWLRKPIALITVSSGPYGGVLVSPSLVFTLWKKGCWVVPARYNVASVEESFAEDGTPADKTTADRRATAFLQELYWCAEARRRMADYSAG